MDWEQPTSPKVTAPVLPAAKFGQVFLSEMTAVTFGLNAR